MAHAATLFIEHSVNRSRRGQDDSLKRMAEQIRSLKFALDEAKLEIEMLTAERDELVAALKDWAADRA